MIRLIVFLFILVVIFAALLAGPGAAVFTATAWVLVKVGLFTAPNWYLVASTGTFAGAIVGAIVGIVIWLTLVFAK